MFAPVAARLLTYRPPMPGDATAYCDAVRDHALVEEWYALAALEPKEWRLPRYETLV